MKTLELIIERNCCIKFIQLSTGFSRYLLYFFFFFYCIFGTLLYVSVKLDKDPCPHGAYFLEVRDSK